MLPMETNNLEVNYSPTRISGGGGECFKGIIAQNTQGNEIRHVERYESL